MAEDNIGAERNFLTVNIQKCAVAAEIRRGKLPLLVKFRIVGQIGFRHYSEYFAVRQSGGAVVELKAVNKRQSDRDNRIFALCVFRERQKRFFRGVFELVRVKQVAAGVAGNTKLRQYKQIYFLLVRKVYELFYFSNIFISVRHGADRQTAGSLYKTVIHIFSPLILPLYTV